MRIYRNCGSLVILLASLLLCASVARAQVDPIPGSLHTQNPGSFNGGTGKLVDLEIGTSSSSAAAIAIQSDDRIVLAGRCNNGAADRFCLARLNRNGSLDQSFDGPLSEGVGDGKFSFSFSAFDGYASALAIQSDNKIIVAGSCADNTSRFGFCATRLHANGAFDLAFGLRRIQLGSVGNDLLRTLVVRPNGKVLLIGTCNSVAPNFDAQKFCVAQLASDGSLDQDFDASTNANGKVLFDIDAVSSNAAAARLLPDGRLVIVGACTDATSTSFCAARIHVDGTFDADFDGPNSGGPGDGRFRFSIPSASAAYATAVALQADGMTVLGGQCSANSKLSFCVARLNSNGEFDPTFDGESGDGDGRFVRPVTAVDSEFLSAMEAQPDGKILLLGTCGLNNAADFCLARLYDDGRLDRSFDSASGAANGAFKLPLVPANTDSASAIALQADGQILVAGRCATAPNNNDRFCIARLNGGPRAARECRLDIDGDGRIYGTNDALIMSRVMRGMRGASVIAGITFASNASRSGWPLIRDYLVLHCGLSVD
jgi:uncharacterized delta-60 repeat protein